MAPSPDKEKSQKCSTCSHVQNIKFFKPSRDGFSKTCEDCSKKRALRYAKALGKDVKEEAEGDHDAGDFNELSEMSMATFLATLAVTQDEVSLDAKVDISTVVKELGSGKEPRIYASKVAEMIWKEGTHYRFNYHSVYLLKKAEKTRFMFSCAQSKQRQRKSKKATSDSDGKRLRDREAMEVFDCHGWLHITLDDNNPKVALIKITHQEAHIPYTCIDVPHAVKDYVYKNINLTPTQLWNEILQKDPSPPFSQRSIYHLWSQQNSERWKLDQDELTSSIALLRQLEDSGSIHQIGLHEEEGIKALAFSLPSIMNKCGELIREVSLDSAWKTNGSNYEVFALLGEVHGSGCPIGYLFIQSNQSHAGAKERYITRFLTHFRDVWKLCPIITLTDKDPSEINACQEVFPEAKHQLCFWHCLRAVKTRLSTVRRQPRYYDVLEAKKEFPYIDKEFVPIAQAEGEVSHKDMAVPQRTIPRLKVFLNNKLMTQPPQPMPPVGPSLTIRLNGIVQSVVTLPDRTSIEDITHTDDEDEDNEDDDLDSGPGLKRDVEKYIQASANDQDMEDGPDWLFESGEKTARDTGYVFCPPAHRAQILRLFTSHFCQHPAFPERRQTASLTANQIRKNAVGEMYKFCKDRNLREVWGYLWSSWYSPKMWDLWARASSEYISRLRTTMNVENFWRQLKHDFLHHIARARLDQLIWILDYRVTTSYIARLSTLSLIHRLGRSGRLSTFQKYFKASWRRLEKVPCSDKLYTVNVHEWKCNCGQQKYNAYHLCKHLVQAVKSPPVGFWSQVVRRRRVPLYRHRWLVARSNEVTEVDSGGIGNSDIEVDGCITDGDDGEWDGDREILRGGGGWEDLVEDRNGAVGFSAARPGKRKREFDNNDEAAKEHQSSTQMHEVIDLTGDWSTPSSDIDMIPITSMVERQNTVVRSSSPSAVPSEDEDDRLHRLTERWKKRIGSWRMAADMAEGQLVNPRGSLMWLERLDTENIGQDLEVMVQDIKREEGTARKADNTWPKDKEGRRRMKNTMGYKVGLWKKPRVSKVT